MGADRLVALQQLVGCDGAVEAGLAQVHVSVGGEGGEEGEEGSRVHVVIVIYMTQPSAHTHR